MAVEADTELSCATILYGWACEARVSAAGHRQVVAILLPGDILFASPRGDLKACVIAALTQLELSAEQRLSEVARPRGAAACGGVDRARPPARDHIVRLGALGPQERTIDVLLELQLRLSALDLVEDDGFRAPITQEAFSDVVGLTVAQMNRCCGDCSGRA